MEDCIVTTQVVDEFHCTFYSRDGVIVAECRKSTEFGVDVERWYRNGKYHRDDGPAEIWYRDGQITEEYWYHHDKLHRIDGPR